MTYGYEIEGLADTAARLGVTVGRPITDIVNAYAVGLPIDAAHVVQTGNRTFRVYWVSGNSLVVLENLQPEHGAVGFSVQASAKVYPLRTARVSIEALAFQLEAPAQEWDVARTLHLEFAEEDETITVTLPDPLSLPLDNDKKRAQAGDLLNAVLRAINT
ncbi:hypothetical protein [Mycobacterium sp. 236(2023)]|uniref:hypothetical protein n=1 Tax=Mycobacterium sp. 236(2023) TaxID=3038163 RepID=UPI00241544F1|nr:hypothetical protein [Mycobacterium sp. 236(2023)]MDG4669005.1 hypothetical protein [Mycobacterium sp. 236(2023)]